MAYVYARGAIDIHGHRQAICTTWGSVGLRKYKMVHETKTVEFQVLSCPQPPSLELARQVSTRLVTNRL